MIHIRMLLTTLLLAGMGNALAMQNRPALNLKNNTGYKLFVTIKTIGAYNSSGNKQVKELPNGKTLRIPIKFLASNTPQSLFEKLISSGLSDVAYEIALSYDATLPIPHQFPVQQAANEIEKCQKDITASVTAGIAYGFNYEWSCGQPDNLEQGWQIINK